MTTRAEEIAAKEYPNEGRMGALHERDAFVKGYKQGQMDRWISVEERLPEDGVKVMVTHEHGTVELALLRKHYDRTAWANSAEDRYSWWIMEAWTHWSPIPSPPNPEQR